MELLISSVITGTSTLAAAISASDTIIQVAAGAGVLFPTPGEGDFFWLQLAQSGIKEIVRCTWRQGDQLRVIRGQQKTLAQPFTIGATVLMQSTAETVAGVPIRQIVDGWYQNNVVASQTGVLLQRIPISEGYSNAWIAPSAGSLVAVTVRNQGARQAGTQTVAVLKNAAGTGLQAVLDAVNTIFKRTAQAIGTIPFAAGDLITIAITTDGAWLPTTSDAAVSIEVAI